MCYFSEQIFKTAKLLFQGSSSSIHRPRLSISQSVEVDIIDVPMASKDGDDPWVDKVFSKNQVSV